MLHRPSKAVMARIVEAFGALIAALTQPFVSHDVGYAQVVPGQKSPKVRNHMLRKPFKSVIARAAIFAIALSLAIPFVSGGLTSAQEAADDPCEMDATPVTCDYDENGTDAVATFTATDPEGEGIDWALDGEDDEFFDITGGVLTFKKSPNFEMPTDKGRLEDEETTEITELEDAGNNKYLVTVTATEMLALGQEPPAKSTPIDVVVTVKDVDEPGSISLNRIQPQVGAALTATLSDPDQRQ